jgi:hypothetical protein
MMTKIYLWFMKFWFLIKDKYSGKPADIFDRGLRSSQWAKIRKEHLELEPTCQWCNSKEDLEVHHIIPFHECIKKGHPELELDHSNLITLCEKEGNRCHLIQGHNGNFRTGYSIDIKIRCEKHKEILKHIEHL